MQLLNKNLYGAIIGNLPQLKPQHNGQEVFAQKGNHVAQILFPSTSKAAGQGKWLQRAIARSDPMARWKIRVSWPQLGQLALLKTWWHLRAAGEKECQRRGEVGPCALLPLFCKGTFVTAALHLLLLFLFRYTSTCEQSDLGVQAMLKWLNGS